MHSATAMLVFKYRHFWEQPLGWAPRGGSYLRQTLFMTGVYGRRCGSRCVPELRAGAGPSGAGAPWMPQRSASPFPGAGSGVLPDPAQHHQTLGMLMGCKRLQEPWWGHAVGLGYSPWGAKRGLLGV